MAQVKLTIEIDGATFERTFDPKKIKLKTQQALEEARETGKWRDLIPVVGAMLGLTPEQAGELTMGDFEGIFEAIKSATEVPNASASPSPSASEA